MRAKPTPGPWSFSKNHHGHFSIFAQGLTIAEVWAGEEETEETMLDNAMVMAAAPHLMTALTDLVEKIQDLGLTRHGLEEEMHQALSALKKTRR